MQRWGQTTLNGFFDLLKLMRHLLSNALLQLLAESLLDSLFNRQLVTKLNRCQAPLHGIGYGGL